MRCIYCLKPSDDSKHRAHVFPEAVLVGGPTLPLGVECDRCNAYAGQKLETVLVRHTLIALPLQASGARGKNGLRQRLGRIEREPAPGAAVVVPTAPPRIEYGPDGVKRAHMTPLPDKNMDYARFSRALHHIAFNVFAYEAGAEAALSTRYDPVRRFVRQPRNGAERWTYAELCEQLTVFESTVTARTDMTTVSHLVELTLCNVRFYVDLLNSGDLDTATFEGAPGAPKPVSAALVQPDWVPPAVPEVETTSEGKQRRWRVRIK